MSHPTTHFKKTPIEMKAKINCIILWDFLKFYQTFLSPQVKWCTIITYKHGLYDLPHMLSNGLIRKYQESV